MCRVHFVRLIYARGRSCNQCNELVGGIVEVRSTVVRYVNNRHDRTDCAVQCLSKE
jgi:hypothetical protein